MFLSDAFIDFRETGVNEDFVNDAVDNIVDEHVPTEPGNTVYAHTLTGDGVQDFGAQCNSATGGFSSNWEFAHTCAGDSGSGSMCEDDTVVTQYRLDHPDDSGHLGDSGGLSTLDVNGEPADFPSSAVWTDVDPLDGNPDRNDNTCDRPLHHAEDDEQEDHRGEQIDDDAEFPCGHSH